MENRVHHGGILLGQRHTSVFNRIIAKGIDLLVLVAILFLGKAIWVPLGIGLALFFCALQDAMGEGQSIGKRIMGLRVTNIETGQPCSFGSSFIRNIPFFFAVLLGSIPLLWIFFLLLVLPVIVYEIYIISMVDTGVRLGDVMGNTLVVEFDGERSPVFE